MEIIELSEQNPWWKDREEILEDYDIIKWNQKKYHWIPDVINKIKFEGFSLHIILGPRQAGKTTLLKLMIKNLLEKEDSRSLFYFNCENLSDNKELLEVLNTYLEFKENNSIQSSIILLDEVNAPKEWYKAIKFLIDSGKLRKDVLVITGSSSMAVKKEVELFPGRRGKGEDFILLPLSFRSFLKVVDNGLYEKIPKASGLEELEKKSLNTILYQKELDRQLLRYMEYGGYPLSIATLDQGKEEAKRVYLNWIKNAILKADRSDLIARQIIKVLVESLQSDLSWEGIAKKIEIKSPKTVSAYIEFLKSIFVVSILYNIDISEKKIRFAKNKKIHLRDPLLLDIFEDWCLVKNKNHLPAIAESLVVEHLLRMYPEKLFFLRNSFEIDAIVLEKEKLFGVEVKWTEKEPLVKFPNQIKKLIIVTKKDYSKKNSKIPLSVFLSMLEV